MVLTASTRSSRGVTIIDLSGRITLGDPAALLRDTVRREADKNPRLLLNFAEVNFVDSAGLGELVGCYTTLLNRRGSVRLVNVQPRLKELLKMTRLYTLFEVYDDEQAALDSFGRTTGA
jgi:anti-sigma B factor antagonist